MSWFNAGTMSTYRARSASTTRTETLKIKTIATGLDDGDFNWLAFGQNKKFKAWINVAYVEDRKPGESVATERHKVSEDFEINSEDDIDATVTIDASKTVDYYFLITEYDNDDAAFKINAFFGDAPSLSPKATSDLIFQLDIYQIVSTKVTYNLLDEYGKAIDLNNAKEEKPEDADLKNLGKIGAVMVFDLKKNGTEILRKEKKVDEWDLMDSSLALSLTKTEIKSGGIDYKLSSTYDVLNGGTVTIQRQKDAVTPKDPHNPGDIPEGYARLNLSANATGAGPKGTFTKDDPQDTQRVVDVKAGKPYTTAQADIEKQGKPFPLTDAKKVDTGKTFDKWAPALSTLGDAVAKETKILNATYKSSDVDIIPYLPGEEVPTKDKDGLPIPENYLTITFKSEDAAKGKIKIGDKEGDTVLAKVKPGIDLSTKAEITTKPAENYGFTKWNPELGVVNENKTFTAHFIKSGDKIKEGDPIPKDWFKVTVSQDEDSIKAGTVTKAVYTVKPNDKLGQDKFAKLEGKANDGYKDPAWYVGSEKLEKPYEKEITTSTDFIARATEEIANKFKNNGLKAVDITAYKGDKIEGKFWNKGVTVQREDAVLGRLIEAATVTDITETKRTTDNAGTFPGTLKVTFEDGSSLEVKNQRLIVIDTKVDIDYDKDSKKDANAPRHKDEVVKGRIKSEETLEGAKVEILDKDDKVIGITLAKADGTFIAGTRELKAGETIKVRVTLPKAGKASPAVEKLVGLNPDELNSILPTAEKLLENLKDKPGVSKAKLNELEKQFNAGKALIDADTKKPAKSVPVTDKGQEQLDEAYKAIKAAIKDLTENKIPEFTAPSYKEIFVGDDINLDDGVTVKDDNIKQVDGKDYSYTIYDGTNNVVEKAAMVAKDGVYRVVYTAEDTQGVKAEHTMTVVVKKTVVEVPGEFPEKTPEGYVKVEFKSGENAGLNGVSKFLVKKDSPKSAVTEPTIVPKEGYRVAEPKWSVAIPETFSKDFETEAQVLKKVTTTEPDAKDKDKYAKLTFEKGDHGEFVENAKTEIWVLKDEKVQFNAPEIKAADGFTFAGWEPKLQESYKEDTKHVAQYASNSDISDVEVKGFQEVKFISGTDGKFEGDKTEKSVWVRPGKLVDLRTKAPTVTVTTTGKSHIGWDKDLVQTFTKAETPTVINAKYGDTVKTIEPDAKDKEKYAKVDFSAGNLGTIAADATKTYWVVKDAEVKLTPPTVTANKGWKVKTGNDAWSPAVATKYTQDTIHLAQYDYDGASVVPQKPGDKKPDVPNNFVKVEFKKGDHGVISSEETTIYWVNPEKEVTLTTPTVTPSHGYKHTGWNPEVKENTKYTEAKEFVAQYKATVLTEDPNDKEHYAKVEFLPGDQGTLEGTTTYWVWKGEKVSFNAPKVTANKNYKFKEWDKPIQETYDADTTHTATYESTQDVSDTEVKGFQEVKFMAGTDGNFGKDGKTPITEKSVWVRPGVEVDLTTKAPKVIANEGKVQTGWDRDLVGTFTKSEKPTEITAQYSDDKDGNGVADDKEQFDIKKATKVEIIKNPDKMKYLVNKPDGKAKFETAGLVVKFTDDSGKSATYTAEELAKMNEVTIKPANNEEIGLTPEGKTNEIPFEVSVNGKTNEVKPNVIVQLDADGNGTADEDEFSATPENVKAMNQNTEEGEPKKVTDKEKTTTTVTGKVKPGATVKITSTDGKTDLTPAGGVTVDKYGNFTAEITKQEVGTEIKVTATEKGKKESQPATAKVFRDSDNDGQDDTQAGQTERPAAIASNKGKTLAFTTIEGKTEKGATITVTVKVDGKEKPVTVENLKVNDDGTYTLEAKYENKALENGAEILVYAENAPKKISKPQTTTVFNDFNEDGKPDGGKVDLDKIKDIQVIDPKKMTYVEGTDGKLNLTGLKVVVRDTLGGMQIFDYNTTDNKFKDGDTALDGFTVKVGDKEVKQDTDLTSADHNNKKIIVSHGKTTGETVQALKVTKTLLAPEVDDVKKGDTTVKVKVPTNGETKITVKVGDKEVVVEKDPQDGQWKVGNKPVNTVDGKLQIPVDELKQGDVVKVTTEDAAGNKGETEKQVPVDEYSAKPTDLKAKNEPATPDKTTVTGKATSGAVITIQDKDGKVLTTEPKEVKSDGDGNFTATIDKKDPNTLLLVTAKEEGKEPSADVPTQVEGSSDVVPVDPNQGGKDKPEGFVTVTFAIKDADKAKGSLEGGTAYYVNPKVDVQLNPPTFKAETGFKLDGWNQAGKLILDANKYTVDTTINAVIGEVADVVPGKDPNTGKDNEKPAGYVEISFAVDKSKGKFADEAETKFFVNPKKEIKLTAPEVTVTDLTYTFEGWDNANWNGKDFDTAKYETDTLISAKLKGSTVEKPQVDNVTTGDTTVNVNPGDADKVTVVVEGQGTVVVKKDPNDGNKWKTPDGKVVTPDNEGKLPVPVQPIGEKALVEVTVEKDGVVSEKVSTTAQKVLALLVATLTEGRKGITVTTNPRGAKVSVYYKDKLIKETVTDGLGVATIILDKPMVAGQSYKVKAELDGYLPKENTVDVVGKTK